MLFVCYVIFPFASDYGCCSCQSVLFCLWNICFVLGWQFVVVLVDLRVGCMKFKQACVYFVHSTLLCLLELYKFVCLLCLHVMLVSLPVVDFVVPKNDLMCSVLLSPHHSTQYGTQIKYWSITDEWQQNYKNVFILYKRVYNEKTCKEQRLLKKKRKKCEQKIRKTPQKTVTTAEHNTHEFCLF